MSSLDPETLQLVLAELEKGGEGLGEGMWNCGPRGRRWGRGRGQRGTRGGQAKRRKRGGEDGGRR